MGSQKSQTLATEQQESLGWALRLALINNMAEVTLSNFRGWALQGLEGPSWLTMNSVLRPPHQEAGTAS